MIKELSKEYFPLFDADENRRLVGVLTYGVMYSSFQAVQDNPSTPSISWKEYTDRIRENREMRLYLGDVLLTAMDIYEFDEALFTVDASFLKTMETAPADENGIIHFPSVLSEEEGVWLINSITMKAEDAYYESIYAPDNPNATKSAFALKVLFSPAVMKVLRRGIELALRTMEFDMFWDWNTTDWQFPEP